LHPRTRQSLLDVADACQELEFVIAGISLEIYHVARSVQLNTERLFITVGEALTRAEKHDPELVNQLSNVRNIIGMRNRIVHGYDAIELETVWTAAVRHAPVLRSEVLALLREDESGSS
jgi:uncharacterized protein with HEPN domain